MARATAAEALGTGSGEGDADVRAAFGALLGGLPKEILERVIPAKRAVMLGRVSKGARAGLATVRPGATVQAKEGRREITGLAGRLRGMLSWCRITGLHLRDVILRMADVEELVGVLGQCGSLAHLDLGGNSIGDEGARRLAGVLGQCRSLAHLDLGYNGIGDEGAGGLAAVAKRCSSLTICLERS